MVGKSAAISSSMGRLVNGRSDLAKVKSVALATLISS